MNYPSIALGMAAGVVVPRILSFGMHLMRGVAVTGIKGGMMVYGTGAKTIHEARQTLTDIAAEARDEVYGGAGGRQREAERGGQGETEPADKSSAPAKQGSGKSARSARAQKK